MQLKRLEAYGFKSFAERIVIMFDEGITAVVGPNGSGKSNITDAIRWVLGEQNIRTLRGLRSEDIIFAGSAGRRALSVAEVVLVFDNRDKSLSIDYEEVIVKRRLYRNGDSEIYLNDARCRIKDIYQLFADTGIGHDGMSIIGQNRLNDILDSRPEERRVFFEETAGITKYRTRKQEALRRLRENDGDLIRLRDIMHAQAAELEPLSKQAKKTETHRTLVAERRQYQLTSLVRQYERLSDEKAKLDDLMRMQRDAEAMSIQKRSHADEEKHVLGKAIGRIDTELAEKEEKIRVLQEKCDHLNKKAAVLMGRRDQGMKRKDDLEKLMASDRSKIEATAQELIQIEHMLAQKRSTYTEKNQTSLKKRTEIEALGRTLHQQEQQAAHSRKSYEAAEHVMAKLREQLAVLTSTFERDDAWQREQQENLSQKKESLHELQGMLRDKVCSVSQMEQQLHSGEQEHNQVKYMLEKAQEEGRFLEAHIRETEGDLQQMRRNLEFLRKMQESYEGFGKDVQTVLQSTEPWRRGVSGAVAELIHIPEQYLTAIEVALGGSVRSIVTEDAQVAKAAISYLKRQHGGRVTFLPLTTIVVRQPRDIDLASIRGAVGWASHLVTTQGKYQKVVDHLLAQTLVIESLDDALAAAKALGYRIRIVTGTGELLSPGGSLSGGGRRKGQSFLLNRQHEIDKLSDQARMKTEQYHQLQHQLEEHVQLLRDQQEQRAAIRERMEQIKQKLIEERGKCDVLKERIKNQDAAVRELETATHMQTETAAGLQEKKTRVLRHLMQCEAHARRFSEELEQTNACIEKIYAERTSIERLAHALEVDCAALNAEILTGADHHKLREMERKEAMRALADVTAQIADLTDELSADAKAMEELSREIAEQDDILRERLDACRGLKDQRIEYEARTRLFDDEIKKYAAEIDNIRGKLHESDKNLDRVSVRMDDCRSTLLSDFGMTPDAAASEAQDIADDILTAQMQRLDDAIRALGSINPNAIEEYAERKARYDEEEAQIRDLQAAKEDIEQIIRKIDTDMSRTFREAFEQIQRYFNEIFIRLFGGGTAELRLTAPEDILSSGVEILVTLPEKKRQNLSALSGGERALTVIALLFSFLKYRPSPFSILDEIDAPLDEANVSRFGDFLQEFAKHTQFIVVTHRKGTMRAADTMYGVTVEDAGVSKILSIRLQDYESVQNASYA